MKQDNNTLNGQLLCVEFGYKQCEKGNNMEMAIKNFLELSEQPAKEQSSNREEELKTELECMYSLNREGWNKVEFYEKEKSRIGSP